MSVELSRLRAGEVIAAVSAVLLLVGLFALPWYGVRSGTSASENPVGGTASIDGWNGLNHLRWLLLAVIIGALALAYFQAARPAPALPVTLSVIMTVLGFVNVLALIYRVLINVPGSDSIVSVKAGAYLGLGAALGILCGAFASLRREGISPRDAPAEIQTIRTGAARGS